MLLRSPCRIPGGDGLASRRVNKSSLIMASTNDSHARIAELDEKPWEVLSRQVSEFTEQLACVPDAHSATNSGYPKISVVIPSYNQVQFLEMTLRSILNQDYPNTEIIIMDGGSTDGTVELLKQYERYVSYWVSEPDKGQAAAINRGMAMATGQLIGWQNSDDLYLPGYFQLVADALQKYPDGDLFFGNVYLIDDQNNVFQDSRFVPFSLRELSCLGWNLSSQAVFIQRSLLTRVGPMREDISVGFDWDWFIRMGQIVSRPILLGQSGGCYRVHPASKLSTESAAKRAQIEQDIRRTHGIPSSEDEGIGFCLKIWLVLRRKCFRVLLYSRFPGLVWLRPMLIRTLERVGVVCYGFI